MSTIFRARAPLTRDNVRRWIENLKIAIVLSNGHGIEIRRTGHVVHDKKTDEFRLAAHVKHIGGCHHLEQRWRVHSGGGIAGNSQVWWIELVGGRRREIIGPLKTKTALTRTLRQWKKWEIP